MKRLVQASFVVLAILMMCAASGQAAGVYGCGRGGAVASSHGRGGGAYYGRGGGHYYGGSRYYGSGHYYGGGWGWGPTINLGWWGLGYPFYGYPYYPYYDRPPVIVEQPSTEIYVQPAPLQSEDTGYWYFCKNPEGYYPYVKNCPSGWMKVVPPSSTPPR